MHDLALPLPTKWRNGIARCFCGDLNTDVTLASKIWPCASPAVMERKVPSVSRVRLGSKASSTFRFCKPRSAHLSASCTTIRSLALTVFSLEGSSPRAAAKAILWSIFKESRARFGNAGWRSNAWTAQKADFRLCFERTEEAVVIVECSLGNGARLADPFDFRNFKLVLKGETGAGYFRPRELL
jgi:hypothetical protein